MRINASRLQWSINHDSLTIALVRREYDENVLWGFLDAVNWSENYEFEYKSLLYNHPFATYCSFYGGRPKFFDPSHLVLQFFELWEQTFSSGSYSTRELGIIQGLMTVLPLARWEVKVSDDPAIGCVYQPLIAVGYSLVDGEIHCRDAHKIPHPMGTSDHSAGFLRIDVLEALR